MNGLFLKISVLYTSLQLEIYQIGAKGYSLVRFSVRDALPSHCIHLTVFSGFIFRAELMT